MKEEILVKRFKVLGHPQKFRLFMLLGENSLYVLEIADRLGISQSSASHYLKDMEYAELIKKERKDNKTYYSLSDEGMELYRKVKELLKKEKK